MSYTLIDPEYESLLTGLVPWTEATLSALPGSERIKARAGRLVYRIVRDGRVFYCKRYQPRYWWRRLLPFTKGKGERLVTEAAYMRGLPVPRVVAYAEHRGDTFLVLTEVGAKGHLVEVLRHRRAALRRGARRDMIRRLAEFLLELHAKGFVHDDLSALHIRVDAGDRLSVIDLDHGRFMTHVPDDLRLHNLLQFYRSMTRLHPRRVDVYAFFKYYCDRVPHWRGREKTYWRRLANAMDYRTRSARGLFFRMRYAMVLRGWVK